MTQKFVDINGKIAVEENGVIVFGPFDTYDEMKDNIYKHDESQYIVHSPEHMTFDVYFEPGACYDMEGNEVDGLVAIFLRSKLVEWHDNLGSFNVTGLPAVFGENPVEEMENVFFAYEAESIEQVKEEMIKAGFTYEEMGLNDDN